MPEIIILGTQGTIDHTRPLLDHFGDRVKVESDWRASVVAASYPDLVITFDESQSERGLCISELARQNVATLLVMDGIPEWRNTWSRARTGAGRPINQPVLSHKVACLGRADARLYESWGNIGKCEVVGAPRFDQLVRAKRPARLAPVDGRPLRLLVMTAKMPGFTPQEVEITLRSLKDLKDHLEQRVDIQVVWRITQGLHQQLGVRNTFLEAVSQELHALLGQVDAVITTPSTAMLEGMLFGLPVALLDYHNCPHYIPAAWRITCGDQIAPVLADLRQVPLERMLYQDHCLQDALACKTPALPRLIQLIEEMVRIRKQQIANQPEQVLVFPHRILNDAEDFITWPDEHFDLQKLYPNHPVFASKDLAALQMELDAAVITIEQLKEQVNTLTGRLHRVPGYLAVKKLAKSLRRRFA